MKGPSRRHASNQPQYLSSYCLLLTRRSSLTPTLHLSIHAAQSTLSHTSNSHHQDHREPSESTSCHNANLATLVTGTLKRAHSPKAQRFSITSPHRRHFRRKPRPDPPCHPSIALGLLSWVPACHPTRSITRSGSGSAVPQVSHQGPYTLFPIIVSAMTIPLSNRIPRCPIDTRKSLKAFLMSSTTLAQSKPQ
jgi:hypothetical protein